MIIYNVLLKGVEKSISFCKAFADFSEAQKWIEEDATKRKLLCKSSSGYANGDQNTIGNYSDYRFEDEDGNTFYYVTYTQQV